MFFGWVSIPASYLFFDSASPTLTCPTLVKKNCVKVETRIRMRCSRFTLNIPLRWKFLGLDLFTSEVIPATEILVETHSHSERGFTPFRSG